MGVWLASDSVVTRSREEVDDADEVEGRRRERPDNCFVPIRESLASASLSSTDEFGELSAFMSSVEANDGTEDSSFELSDGGRELVDCVNGEGVESRELDIDSECEGGARGKIKLPSPCEECGLGSSARGATGAYDEGPGISDSSIVAWRIISCE